MGYVDHFLWKKEYQARGAPHFHVLLWIRDAPVIGEDDPGLDSGQDNLPHSRQGIGYDA